MSKHVVEITDTNFASEVLQAKMPVLVDFWAEWCAPCRALGPTVEAVATEYAGRARVGKVNVDHNPTTASQFGIRSIPTLIIFKNGQPAEQIIGSVSKAKLEDVLKKHL